MTDVFISYAHEDHEYVRRMAPAFEAEGFTVWWDHSIPPGKTWDEVIAKGIADARCCIVLWSKNSVISDWVKEEATIAKDHKKFIPVQIDNSEPPVGFRRIQAAHLQNWSGNTGDPQWQMLVREVRSVTSASRASGAPSTSSRASYAQPPTRPPGGAPPRWAIGVMVAAAVIAIAAVFIALSPGGNNETPPPEHAAVAPDIAPPEPAADPAAEREARERAARQEQAVREERERAQAAAAEREAREIAVRQEREREAAAAAAERERASNPLGAWRGQIIWRGANTIDISWTFSADGAIVTSANERGTWSRTRDGFRGTYRGGGANDLITFQGRVSGNRISGDIQSDYQDGYTGTFAFSR